MGVPRFTTPTFLLSFSETELDLTQATSVYVTFQQADTVITFTGERLTVAAKTIAVSLTQEEAGRFFECDVEIQANWIINGKRVASGIVMYPFSRQLLQGVIS